MGVFNFLFSTASFILFVLLPLSLGMFERRFLLITLAYIIIRIWIAGTSKFGSSYAPTPSELIGKIVRFGGLKRGDKLYDLGSGDGRVILDVSKNFGISSVGVEIDPIRYLMTKLRILFQRQKNCKIIFGDFYKISLKDATAVFLYLPQKTIESIERKLKLNKGSKVITYRSKFRHWKPEKIDRKNRIFLYKI